MYKIVIALVLIFTAFNIMECHRGKVNIPVESIDSVQIVLNKNKELAYKIQVQEKSISELKKENSDLYEEVKKYSGKPKTIIKYVPKIEYRDTVIRDTVEVVFNDSVAKFKIDFSMENRYTKNDYILLKGSTFLDVDIKKQKVMSHYTKINDLSLSAEIKQVHTSTGYYFQSDFPNLSVHNAQAISLMKQKKKKYGISIFGGPAVIHDLKRTSIGFGIGIGLSYDIFQF